MLNIEAATDELAARFSGEVEDMIDRAHRDLEPYTRRAETRHELVRLALLRMTETVQ